MKVKEEIEVFPWDTERPHMDWYHLDYFIEKLQKVRDEHKSRGLVSYIDNRYAHSDNVLLVCAVQFNEDDCK